MVETIRSQSSASSREPTGLPPGTVIDRMFQAMNDHKKLGNRSLQEINEDLEAIYQKMDSLQKEKIETLQKEIDAGRFNAPWGVASYLCSSLYACASIVGGSYLLATGQPIGQQFIAAGVVLLANKVLSHRDRWEAIAQTLSFGNTTVKSYLHSGLPKLAEAVAFLWNIYSMVALPQDLKTKIAYAQTLYGIVSSVINIHDIYTTVIKFKAEGHIKVLDTLMSSLNTRINQLLIYQGILSSQNKTIQRGWRQPIKSQFNTTFS